MKVVIVENSESGEWLEPFKNLLDVVKNTFAQFLNVTTTFVRLIFTMDDKEVYEIIDKYYDRMKSINAKTAEVMNKIEQSSGDMSFFTFLYNPAGTVTARMLAGGPGALRNFIDFYKEATGVSLNPFDIGPPGARDSASLMNNRMNYAMGFGYGSSSGGGRGTASSRVAKQLENRLNRAFGLNIDPNVLRARPAGGSMGSPPPSAPPRFESFEGSGLPILVEAANPDPFGPLSDAEFKKAVAHFMKQVDFSKLGVKSEATQVSTDMSNLANEMSVKLSRPYDLIMRLSRVENPTEMYEILNEMKKEGFQIAGLEALRPEKIESLTDETVERAKEDGKIDELFAMSKVKPKDPKSPTEQEINDAAKEVVSKTVMSRSVNDSKLQIENALKNSKTGILKKFDETFLPKNSEDAKLLMKTKFGNDFRSARAKIESAGIPLENQVKVDTTA